MLPQSGIENAGSNSQRYLRYGTSTKVHVYRLARYLPLFLVMSLLAIISYVWLVGFEGMPGPRHVELDQVQDIQSTLASGGTSSVADEAQPASPAAAVEATSLKHVVFGIASYMASWPTRSHIIRHVTCIQPCLLKESIIKIHRYESATAITVHDVQGIILLSIMLQFAI